MTVAAERHSWSWSIHVPGRISGKALVHSVSGSPGIVQGHCEGSDISIEIGERELAGILTVKKLETRGIHPLPVAQFVHIRGNLRMPRIK